jgi:glycosyltransferase involved in cell wall biosynthesis
VEEDIAVSRLRLLVILPAYEPASRLGGGVVRSMSTLCRALVERGVSVTVYTTNASGEDEPLEVPLGQPVDVGGVQVCYFASTFGSRSMFASGALIAHLQKTVSQFDAVYIAGWFMWIGIAAAAVCRKARVPVIAGTHGGFTAAALGKSRLKKQVYRALFLRKAFRHVAAFRVTSNMEKECSRESLDGRPCLVVPNPVDERAFRPRRDLRDDFRKRCGIPSGAPVLVTVTRFDWMKRVDLLIDAVARSEGWRLVLAGDDRGRAAQELKERAGTLGVRDRVVWAGFLRGDELCAALSASDLFALISETDNFGNVVVEAMMCGLPVLVSKQVGVWEFIQDLRFARTAELSAESIAGCLQQFRTVSDAIPCGAEIRQAAMDRFSTGAVAEQFIGTVRDLLHAGHRGSATGAPVRLP